MPDCVEYNRLHIKKRFGEIIQRIVSQEQTRYCPVAHHMLPFVRKQVQVPGNHPGAPGQLQNLCLKEMRPKGG